MNIHAFWLVLLGFSSLAVGAAKPELAAESLKKGNAWLDKGEFDSAIAAFTEAIRIKPRFAQAYSGRGSCYRMKGEKVKAEEDFARAKKLGYKPK